MNKGQWTINIAEEDWDLLIILDACRYDYFKKYYAFFFEGILTRGYSAGSCTYEWLLNSFRDKHFDIVYVSANPYINSITKINSFRAIDHFYKIIDAWFRYWDNYLGTVLPQHVNILAIKALRRYINHGKRFIVHYLQPHAPYVGDKVKPIKGYPKPNVRKGKILTGIHSANAGSSIFYRIYEEIESGLELCIERLFDRGHGFTWKLREFLHLPPASPMDMYRREYGINKLRKAYERNLLFVLKSVTFLVYEAFNFGLKKIIITSDHGEFLGEGFCFEHWPGSKRDILRVVPWFKVKKVLRVFESPIYSISWRLSILKRRLRNWLNYHC